MKINSRILFAIVILIIGLTVSIVVQLTRNNDQLNTKTNEVNLILENETGAIRHELIAGLSSVEILKYFFEKNPSITKTEFQNYTAPIYMENRSIKAISWVPKISQNQRISFQRAIQHELSNPDFSITEQDLNNRLVVAKSRPYYFPVKYIEPYQENIQAIGFDIFSDVVRKATIIDAIKSNRLIITPRIKLVQDSAGYGFLTIVPVYRHLDATPKLVDLQNIQGLISAVFKINELITNALQKRSKGIRLIINDITTKNSEQIYKDVVSTKGKFDTSKRQIKVANRIWELEFIIDQALFKVDNKYSFFIIGASSTSLISILLLIPLFKTRKNKPEKQLSNRFLKEKNITEFCLVRQALVWYLPHWKVSMSM